MSTSYTIGMSTRTPLAKQIEVIGHVRDQFKKLSMPGYIPSNKRQYLKLSGFNLEGVLEIDNSKICLDINFDRWGEEETPYWISFTPQDIDMSKKIEGWFKKDSGIEFDGHTCLIPIPIPEKGDLVGEITNSYKRILSTIVSQYKPKQTEVSAQESSIDQFEKEKIVFSDNSDEIATDTGELSGDKTETQIQGSESLTN